MSSTLAKWMTLIIAVNIMFTPILAYIDSMHREAVEVVLQEGAKKAAIEGRFTTDILNDMKDELVEHYNFDRTTITIDATTTLKYRSSADNYISASITVPRGPIFITDIFNSGPNEISKSTTIMSEYIN